MNRKEFLEINQEHKDLRLKAIGLESDIRLLEKEHERWCMSQMVEIANAIDEETGKPLFSNAEKRNAELLVRQTSSAEVIELERQLNELKVTYARCRAEIEFLDHDLRYIINHSGEEVKSQLAFINDTINANINLAAINAVKAVLSDIAINAIDIADKANADNSPS